MPQTVLQRLRATRPDLLFDKNGNLIEDDKELVDKLVSKLPKSQRERARPLYYSTLPEESSNTGLLDTLGDIGKEVASALGPTVRPKDEEADLTVGEQIRLTNPRLSKASDEGLARYLKVMKGDKRSMSEISSFLNERYEDRLDSLIEKNSPSAEEKGDSGVSGILGDATLQTLRTNPLIAPAAVSVPAVQALLEDPEEAYRDASDILGGVADSALAGSGTVASAVAGSVGDRLARAATPLLEEDLRAIRRENLAKFNTAQVGGRRLTEADIQAFAEKEYAEREGDTALNLRDSIQARTDQLVDAIGTGTERRRGRAASLRSDALKNATDTINKAVASGNKGAVLSAVKDLTVELATTPEGLYVLAESVPVILATAASRNPSMAAFLTNTASRLGQVQEDKTGDERRATADEDLARSTLAGAVDTLGMRAGMALDRTTTGALSKAAGQVLLGGTSEAAGDYAANPDTSVGELITSATTGGVLTGPAEVVSALHGDSLTPQEEQQVVKLESTGDPLDQAQANMIKAPPPDLSVPEQQELDFGDSQDFIENRRATTEQELVEQARDRILKAKQEDQAYSEGDERATGEALFSKAFDDIQTELEFTQAEKSLLDQYDSAVQSGDLIGEARAEKALDNLYKAKPQLKGTQDQPVTLESKEPLPEFQGQEEITFQEQKPPSPTVEEKRGKTTPALVERAYKDLIDDKYKFKPNDVKALRRQTEKEGGDPSLPPREQYDRLSEEGQDRVVYDIATSRAPVRRSAPKDRVARIVALEQEGKTPSKNEETWNTLRGRTTEKTSSPSTKEGPTPSLPKAEKVQESAPQSVSEPTVDTKALQERVDALPRSRFSGEVLKAKRNGKSTLEAVKQARDKLAESENVLPQEARSLLQDFNLAGTKKDEVNLDTDDASRGVSLPAIKGAPSIVNRARVEKGLDFTVTNAPNTNQAKAATKLAKALGTNLTWVSSPDASQRGIQGGKDIAVNVNADKPVLKVLGHELNHVLKRKREFAARVAQALESYADSKGLQLERAKRRVSGYEVNKLTEEVESDLFGEALQDPNFFRALRKAAGTDTLYDKIVTFIQGVLSRITGKAVRLDKTGGDVTQSALTDVQNFRQSLVDAVEASKETLVPPSKDTNLDVDTTDPTRSDIARQAVPVADQLKNKAKRVLSATAEEFLKVTTAQGVASKDTHDASLDLMRGKTALTKEHERLGHKLRVAAKRHRVSPRDLDKMLKGKLESDTPEVRDAVGAVRNEIDSLTQKLINIGAVKKDEVQKFKDRMASGSANENYVHRSYRAWIDKPGKWAAHLKDVKTPYWESVLDNIATSLAIPPDLQTARKATIDRLSSWWNVDGNLSKDDKIAALEKRRGWGDEAKRGVYESIRDKLADPRGKGVDFVKTYVDSFQSSNKILKERARLPSWLKEFWGEVEDGTFNALTTMEVQANLLQHAVVMEKMAYDLVENDLASDSERPGYSKVNDGGPLSGLWVKDSELEHMGMINSTLQNQLDSIKDSVIGGRLSKGIHAGALKFTSAAKTAQVIGDPSTMAVQAASNAFFSLFFSGQIPSPKQALKGIQAALLDTAYHQDWAGDKQARDKLLRLVELGIASEGAYSSELKAAVHELMGKTLPDGEKIEGNDVEVFTKALVGVAKDVVGATTFIGRKTFQFTDTYSRAVAYEIENDRMKRWYPDLSKTEQERLAAERVRATWPTNSETAPIARWVGKWGLVQPFATFMWENHRNILNNTMIGLHDMKNGASLDQKRHGVYRVLASATAMGGWGYMSSFLGSLLRDEDDEDIKQVPPEHLDKMVAYYYENSPFIEGAGVDENGVLTYYNTGRFNMYEPVSKLVTNSLKGDFDKAAEGWMEDVVAVGFVGELGLGLTDLASATVQDNDKDKKRAWSDIERAFQSLIPGSIKRGAIKPEARERMGSPMTVPERLLELGGFTQHRSRLDVAAGRALRNWSTDTSFIRKDGTGDLLSPDVYDVWTLATTDGEPPTQEQVDEMYKEWVERDRDAYNEASETLKVMAQYLSPRELTAVRKEANVSEEKLQYLLRGVYELPLPNSSEVAGRDFYLLGERNETKFADKDNKEFLDKARKKWQALRRQIPRARRNLQRELEEIN